MKGLKMKLRITIIVLMMSMACYGQNANGVLQENIKLKLIISELEGKISSNDKAIERLRKELVVKSIEIRRLKKLCEKHGIETNEKPEKDKSEDRQNKMPSKLEALKIKLSGSLVTSDRGVKDRLLELKASQNGIIVAWSVNRDNKDEEDIYNMLRILQENKIPAKTVYFHGHYDVKSSVGDRTEQHVFTRSFPGDIVKFLNFDNTEWDQMNAKEVNILSETVIHVQNWRK